MNKALAVLASATLILVTATGCRVVSHEVHVRASGHSTVHYSETGGTQTQAADKELGDIAPKTDVRAP